MDIYIKILAGVTLTVLMFTTGLWTNASDLLQTLKNRAVLIRCGIANFIIVPGLAVALIWLIDAHPLAAVGILIASVCPGAPFSPPFTAMAGGDLATAVGLMIFMAASSAVIAPLLLVVLLPLAGHRGGSGASMGSICLTLFLSQLLPLVIGLMIKQFRPKWGDRLETPMNRLSTGLNIILLILIFISQFKIMISLRGAAFAGMIGLIIGALACGWALGGRSPVMRRTIAFSAGVRKVAVGLVIVTNSFPGRLAVPAITVFALVQTIIIGAVAIVWGRWIPTRHAEPDPMITS